MYYFPLLFDPKLLFCGEFAVRILHETQHSILMQLVKLQLLILFSIPLTIDAKLGYLDHRTDKAGGWRAENTR